MLFLVSYTLNPPRVNPQLIEELQRSEGGWWHYLDTAWILATNENASQLYERLRTKFIQDDRILIIDSPYALRHGE